MHRDRFIRTLTAASALLAALSCASCGPATARKPTFPVEGKVYWKNDKTPAAQALVVFRPVADDRPESWPDGFPRATVGRDGSFKLMTYAEADGAPAGEYAVLVTWPRTTAKAPAEDQDPESSGDGEDRLQGAYGNHAQPRWTKQVSAGPNDPRDFIFIIR